MPEQGTLKNIYGSDWQIGFFLQIVDGVKVDASRGENLRHGVQPMEPHSRGVDAIYAQLISNSQKRTGGTFV